MNVEGGPSGSVGAVASIGSVASAGPSLRVGSLALGREFGPVMTAADIRPIIGEGLVKGGLEMFKPIVQINFIQSETPRPRLGGMEVPKVFQAGLSDVNLDPSIQPPVSQSEDLPFSPAVQLEPKIVISDASRLEVVRETISGLVIPQTQPDFLYPFIPAPALEPRINSKSVLASQVATQPQTESNVSYKTVQAEPILVTQEQAVEQVETEERVSTESREKDIQEHEEAGRVKVLHVIDKKQVVKREKHIVEVGLLLLGKAKIVLGEKVQQVKIKGIDMIGHLLPSNKAEIRGGEINSKDPEEKLPDKTWDATIEQLRGLEFDSVEQIKTQVPEVVLDNHPVIVATEGEIASDKNVVKSHDNNIKSHAHLEFERRKRLKREQIIKISKSSQQPVQIMVQEEKQITEEEDPIQVHPELAEVFQKAA